MNKDICTAHRRVQTFENVHLKLKDPVKHYIFYLIGTTQDSEDVAQEIFVKLWINWKSVRAMSDEELMNYVFIIIRNHIINVRKKINRRERNIRMFLEGEYSKTCCGFYWHDDILIKEGIKLHQRAIERLPKKEKLVYLFYSDDYSAAEIAGMFSRSKHTVHNQISAASKTVKTYLNKYYEWNFSESGRRNCLKRVSLN